MNRFIIKIDIKDIDFVKEFATIVFESKFISGMLGIETDLSIEEVRLKPYIVQVDDIRQGNLYKGI